MEDLPKIILIIKNLSYKQFVYLVKCNNEYLRRKKEK